MGVTVHTETACEDVLLSYKDAGDRMQCIWNFFVSTSYINTIYTANDFLLTWNFRRIYARGMGSFPWKWDWGRNLRCTADIRQILDSCGHKRTLSLTIPLGKLPVHGKRFLLS